MTTAAPDLVVIGQVLVSIRGDEIRTAEAIAIRDGRVVAVGRRDELLPTAGGRTRVAGEPHLAVVPGLHDFHLHLVGMARLRREVRLEGLAGARLAAAVDKAGRGMAPGAWLRGRGWTEAALDADARAALDVAGGDRAALLYSHDAHSAWASRAALSAAGIRPGTDDPPGGRIERDASGAPSGVLREQATDLVEAVAGRLRGPELDSALDEAVAELAAWGVTGASDAGDTSADNGTGDHAALGDRASLLLAAAHRLDGRLRLAIGFPAAAIEAAADLGLATGQPLAGSGTLRGGWAKAYADGALGSRTAATFDAYTCGARDTGILRLTDAELDRHLSAARRTGIGLAVHAIGDRATASVLDALARSARRDAAVPPDRIEHLQLLRPADHGRLAALDITASVQPVHCAADRELVEACWADRASLAYPWRSLREARDPAGVRVRCADRDPESLAGRLCGRASAAPGRRDGRLATEPGAGHRPGAGGVHQRPGGRRREERRGQPRPGRARRSGHPEREPCRPPGRR